MAKPSDIYEGMQLIKKYAKDFTEHSFQAEHDQIWCGEYVEMDPEDMVMMSVYGWFEDEESWSHFT